MTTATTSVAQLSTPGTIVSWRTISGVDVAGKPVYGGYMSGTVLGPDTDDPSSGLYLVRRNTSDRTVVLISPADLDR